MVCLDCLDEWNSDVTICYVLMSLQTLLSEACFENPINEVASEIARKSPIRYKQLVLDGVLSSQRCPSMFFLFLWSYCVFLMAIFILTNHIVASILYPFDSVGVSIPTKT